jgi:RNA recognition motif-containing protein
MSEIRGEIDSSVDSYQVYVGGMSRKTTDNDLFKLFRAMDEHVTNARVFNLKTATGDKCFGFIQFDMDEFAYKFVARINASVRTTTLHNNSLLVREAYRRSRLEIERGIDHLTNTMVFVGNLNIVIGQDPVKDAFSRFGLVEDVTVIPNKGFGFVKFASHVSALAALSEMQNVELFHQRIYCSWGRSRDGSTATEADPKRQKTSIEESEFNELEYSSMFPQSAPIDPAPVDYIGELRKTIVAMGADDPDDEALAITHANQVYIHERMLTFISQQQNR